MREFLLAQGGPDDAVAAPGQAEQDLSDAAGQIQEDQVGSGLGQSAQGGRCRVQQGLDHRRLPRADALHRFEGDEQQLAFVQGVGVGRSRAAVGDTQLTEHPAGLDDRQRELAAVRGPDHDLDAAGDDHEQCVAGIAPGEHHLPAPEDPQSGRCGDGIEDFVGR